MDHTALSPANWPEADKKKFKGIQHREMPGNPIAKGSRGAVTDVYNGMAQRAGLEALKRRGSAGDTALTTAQTQVTLVAGAAISFARDYDHDPLPRPPLSKLNS